MQPILSQMNASGSSAFYTDRWVTIIENHIEYFKELTSTDLKEVLPDIQVRYFGNPIGLLVHLGIPRELHYLIMRLQGWSKPEDYREHFQILYVPTVEQIEKLRRVSSIPS